jgi:hypothetical protein
MHWVLLDVLEILNVFNKFLINWNKKLVLFKSAKPFNPWHSNFLNWFHLLLLHFRVNTKAIISLIFSKLWLLPFEHQLLLLTVIQKNLILFIFVFLSVLFLVYAHLLQFKLVGRLSSSAYIQILSGHLVTTFFCSVFWCYSLSLGILLISLGVRI